MKLHLLIATATVVALATTGCSSSNNAPKAGPKTVPGYAKLSGKSVAASGGGHDSAFCALARKIGKADLGVSSGNLDPDPKKLLGQVDQLDAIAPANLKKDFDVFAAFEHSVLEPGSSTAPPITGDTTAVLEHVSTYFTTTCGIS